ncbi:phage minor capsid protein [Streptococcus suis]|uniref:phage minor capsid protein n=1 Tax=Streptococcus suis TaxID=1307 RepID=UPI003F8C8649
MAKKKPIKLNDQQLMLMASNVSDIYHQLSNDLFDNVVDRLKERGTYYLDKEPYLWQLEKMNSIGMLNDQNVKLMAEYSGIAEEQIRYIIENEGYKVYTDTMEQLGSNEYDNQVMEDLISYSNQAINDVTNLINTTLPKSVIGTYQGIIEKTIAKVVTGMATSETTLHETIMEWHAKGFYGYTDRAGRRQRADSYARTVIKTTVARVNNEMRTRPAEELGVDTFYYSIKAAAREMCAPIQHQIVTTGKARTEAGHKIYALSDYGYGRPEGCRGINCNHIMTPFVPDANYLPEVEEHLKDLTPEQAIQNANAQAKQRALERSIRFTKEQIHVAEKLGDTELIDRYKMKLSNQKHALKAFLDDHKFLYRDRDREKYYEDPLGVAKEEIRQRNRLRKDYEKIKETLGSYAPESLEKYQQIRYNDIEEYKHLKSLANSVEAMLEARKKTIVIDDAKVPILSHPNGVVDLYKDGELIQRRYYGRTGKAKIDIDNTDHKRPDIHKLVPHSHDWSWWIDSKGILKKKRSKERDLTLAERIANKDLKGIRHNE